MNLLKILFSFFLFNILCVNSNAEILVSTVTNRLTNIELTFESTNPVKDEPVYVIPDHVKILKSTLFSEEKESFKHKFELLCFFEKKGRYEIGPFVFKDNLGNAISVRKVTVEVIDKEQIGLKPEKSKTVSIPKFYTLVPYEKLYIFMPIYMILEIPGNIDELSVLWPGWKDVVTEVVNIKNNKDGRKEIIFSAVFTVPGKFNLPPLRFILKNGNDIRGFTTGSIIFDVSEIKSDDKVNYLIGDYITKLNAYSGVEGNIVNVDLHITGAGYLNYIKPPKIVVEPIAEIFLKGERIEYYRKFPEYKGEVVFSYFFKAPSDGIYKIKVSLPNVYSPFEKHFKNFSTIVRSIKVQIPSSPSSKEVDDIEKKLNIRIRPDYDFYLIISLLLFVTIVVFVMYLRTNMERREKPKNRMVMENEKGLKILLKNVLYTLEKITGESLRTSSPTMIKNILKKTDLPENLKNEVEDWIYQSYKSVYLKKVDNKELEDKGLELLKKLTEKL